MSYDVTFEADMGLGDENPDLENGWRNYTSNVSRMWFEALGNSQTLGDLLDPKPIASTLIEPLNRAIATMMETPEYFRAMNPLNGWGSYEGALEYLIWIRDHCVKWPSARVRVSR